MIQNLSKANMFYDSPTPKPKKLSIFPWQKTLTVIILTFIFTLMLQTPTLAQSPLSHSLNVFIHYSDKDENLLLPWQGSDFPMLPIAQLAEWSNTNLSWQKAGTSGAVIWGNELLGLVFIPDDATIRVVSGANTKTPTIYKYEWLETPTVIEGRVYLPISALDLMNISYTMDANTNTIHLYFPKELNGNGNCQKIWQAVKDDVTDELTPKKVLLSTFTTYYDEANSNRSTNLFLATQSLNEVTIKPNQQFSFNQTVGPRTPERGYRKAIIFVGQKKVLDYGGGVCQVSTTLYRAALAANLKILERHSHSQPVDYATKGKDATVAWGSKDLRFLNNTSKTIIIETSAKNGVLTISLYYK